MRFMNRCSESPQREVRLWMNLRSRRCRRRFKELPRSRSRFWMACRVFSHQSEHHKLIPPKCDVWLRRESFDFPARYQRAHGLELGQPSASPSGTRLVPNSFVRWLGDLLAHPIRLSAVVDERTNRRNPDDRPGSGDIDPRNDVASAAHLFRFATQSHGRRL